MNFARDDCQHEHTRMEAKLLFFSRSCKHKIWQYKSIPVSEAYLGSAMPFSPGPSAGDGYSWRILESLIDELKKLCVEGWKLHLLEEPKLLKLDVSDKHHFAKAILTRKLEPSTTTSSDAVAASPDSDLKLEDEASAKTV